MLKKIILIFCILIQFSYAREKNDKDIQKFSEAIGYMIGKSFNDFDFELDLKKLIKGIKNAKDKVKSEDECLQVLNDFQLKINKKLCEKNLKIAEVFLENNSKNQNIITLEDKKIQYEILKEGENDIVKSYNTPIVKVTIKDLKGKVFAEIEEAIDLDETFPTLKKVILGMKENEKRRVYMHPDLAYGKESPYLNALLIFDIEMIKAETTNTSLEELAISNKIFK